CSAFTRVTACTLALSPMHDTLSEGFSHFVTSIAAPVASGWSDCRVGLSPTGKRRLVTAHTRSGQMMCYENRTTAKATDRALCISLKFSAGRQARVLHVTSQCTIRGGIRSEANETVVGFSPSPVIS